MDIGVLDDLGKTFGDEVNTERPNVTDLELNYDVNYLQMLQAGFEESQQFFPAMSVADIKNLEDNYAKNHDWYETIKQMRTREITKEDAPAFLSKVLNAKVADKDKIVELVALIYGLNVLDPKRPKIPIYNETGADPMSVQAHLLQRMVPKGLNLKIETLPIFTISNQYFIDHPCWLIGQQPEIVGSDIGKKAVDAFYTGAYRIYSFEHEISKDNVSSTFNLVKDSHSLSEQDMNIGVLDDLGKTFGDEANIENETP